VGLHKATTAGCDCDECQIIGGDEEVSLSLSLSLSLSVAETTGLHECIGSVCLFYFGS
jgi:hypothetical protein